jgi:LAO/AO transport system kinase
MKTSYNLKQILSGSRVALAKAITLVESKNTSDRVLAQKLIEEILPHANKSIRVGISGSPGVGKSTFIEALGLHLVNKGKKIAVLAVDPSSPITGGSIMGDKTRMEELARHPNAFIRPSPSSGTLGGVAQKSRETMLLCEASGHEIILVETVGVGQNEIEVSNMVDFFLVLMLPNAGDELQGIKKGIIELADALLINKSDGESVSIAKRTQIQYESAIKLLKPHGFWTQQTMTCSALEKKNIQLAWDMIENYEKRSKENMVFHKKRQKQNKEWMWALIRELLDLRLKNHPDVKSLWPKLEEAVLRGEKTPQNAAIEIMEKFF